MSIVMSYPQRDGSGDGSGSGDDDGGRDYGIGSGAGGSDGSSGSVHDIVPPPRTRRTFPESAH